MVGGELAVECLATDIALELVRHNAAVDGGLHSTETCATLNFHVNLTICVLPSHNVLIDVEHNLL